MMSHRSRRHCGRSPRRPECAYRSTAFACLSLTELSEMVLSDFTVALLSDPAVAVLDDG
jgi:hypothetical protein